MAIKKTITTLHGFEATDAYHRVEHVSIDGKDQMSFHVRSYKEVGKPFFKESVISAAYGIDGDNPIKQAYLHLKSLPDFVDAVDC